MYTVHQEIHKIYPHKKLIFGAGCTEGPEFHRRNPLYYKLFYAWYVFPEDGIIIPKHVGMN